MFLRILSVLGVMLAGMLAHPTWASERVALVIGNSDHEHVSRLANPANDASDIGAALGRLGFDVTRLENTSYQDMRRGLQDFKRAASGAEMAVVFYAGHGIEVDKDNFLIPVDARLRTDGDIEFETVSLDLVARTVEGARELGLVILDACRNNPFAMAMERAGSPRSIGRGLARVEPAGGMLVACAARGGTVSSDGTGGRNSPYTEALLAHLEEPGLEVNFMFRKVRDAVRKSTNNTQEPVVYGSLSSEHIYLAGLPAPSKSQPEPAEQSAARAYEAAERLGTPEAFEVVIRRFPDSAHAVLARGKIDALNKARAEAEGAARGKELLDAHGHLAMHLAARNGQVAAMGWLKAQGADINGRDDEGDTPMHWAAYGGHVAAMGWLKAQGADINAWDDNGLTPMHSAAYGGQVAAMGWLKAQGADVNTRDKKYGRTPMHLAARNGQVATMRWLKAQGADINVRDDDGDTPMHEAAWGGRVAAMGWLKAQGADINARRNDGLTPMHKAAYEGQVAAMGWLKARGSDINVRADDGDIPMHLAARNGQVDAMGWLKAQGADINVRDDDGETPLGVAEREGHTKAANWLEANGGHR